MRRIRINLSTPQWFPWEAREPEAVAGLLKWKAAEESRLAAMGLTPNKRLRKVFKQIVSRSLDLIERQKDRAAYEKAMQPQWDREGERQWIAEVAWKFSPEAKQLYEENEAAERGGY